jgi:quinol monooxygenase YgiN
MEATRRMVVGSIAGIVVAGSERDTEAAPTFDDSARTVKVVVTQRILPGKATEYEALARELQANTLKLDDGCLKYEFYRTEERSLYVVIEEWRDESSLQKHLAADHFIAIVPRFSACCVNQSYVGMRLTRLL